MPWISANKNVCTTLGITILLPTIIVSILVMTNVINILGLDPKSNSTKVYLVVTIISACLIMAYGCYLW